MDARRDLLLTCYLLWDSQDLSMQGQALSWCKGAQLHRAPYRLVLAGAAAFQLPFCTDVMKLMIQNKCTGVRLINHLPQKD